MRSKKTLFIIGGACFALLTVLVALAILCRPDSTPLKNPVGSVQEIKKHLTPSSDHAYTVNICTVTEVSGMTLQEDTEATILRQFQDEKPMLTAVQKHVDMGEYQYTCKELLENGILYLDLNGSRFFGEYSGNDPYPPLFLFDVIGFSHAEGTQWNDHITIELSDAVAAEKWAIPEGAEFLSASASVTANRDNILQQCCYTITYQQGHRKITTQYTTTPISVDSISPLQIDKTACIRLSAIDAPLLLEQMSGYLLQAAQISASYDEYIYCQTFGDQRTRNMTISVNNSEPFTAALTTNATLISSSRGEESSSVHQQELFSDGVYSRAVNQSPAVQDKTVTGEQFLTHCQDILVGTVLLPQFIADVTVQEDESSITLTFTPAAELATLLCEEAGQNLYQDPNVLNGIATEFKTEELTAYLKIDKATNLPLSSGIHYKGLYTITELPYQMEYTTDQTYQFG